MVEVARSMIYLRFNEAQQLVVSLSLSLSLSLSAQCSDDESRRIRILRSLAVHSRKKIQATWHGFGLSGRYNKLCFSLAFIDVTASNVTTCVCLLRMF